MCTVYAVRPILCRNAHATDTAAHCYGDDPSGIPASHLDFKPLDDLVRSARALMRATHHAIGGPRRRPTALCVAVHELL